MQKNKFIIIGNLFLFKPGSNHFWPILLSSPPQKKIQLGLKECVTSELVLKENFTSDMQNVF